MFGNSSGLNEILTQNVQAKSGLGPKFSQNMFGLSSGFLTYNWGSSLFPCSIEFLDKAAKCCDSL